MAKLKYLLSAATTFGLAVVAACSAQAPAGAERVASTEQRVFSNGDFENGTSSGWTGTGYASSASPEGKNSIAELVLSGPSGSGQIDIVTAGNDTDFGRSGLQYPRYGSYAARINSETQTTHVSRLGATATVSSADVSTADGKVHIRFAMAVALQTARLPVVPTSLWFPSHPAHTLPDGTQIGAPQLPAANFTRTLELLPYAWVGLRRTSGTEQTLTSTAFYAGKPGVAELVAATQLATGTQGTASWVDFDFASSDAAPLAVGDTVAIDVVVAGNRMQLQGFSSVGPFNMLLDAPMLWAKAYFDMPTLNTGPPPPPPPPPQLATINVTKLGAGSGTVTGSPGPINCGPSCSITMGGGVVETLTATPDPGSIFLGWTGCTAAGANGCTLVSTSQQPSNVTATFSPPTFNVTVQKTGTGSGRVTSSPAGIDCGTTCVGTFSAGGQLTLTAQPGPTSNFAGWFGACNGVAPCAIDMNAPATVQAAFEPNYANLRVTSQVSRISAFVGDTFSARVQLSNAGPNTASGGVLTLTFDDIVSLAAPINLSTASCTAAGTTATCTLADLVAGQQLEAILPLVARKVGTSSSTLVLSANESDPTLTDNTSVMRVNVSALPPIEDAGTAPTDASEPPPTGTGAVDDASSPPAPTTPAAPSASAAPVPTTPPAPVSNGGSFCAATPGRESGNLFGLALTALGLAALSRRRRPSVR